MASTLPPSLPARDGSGGFWRLMRRWIARLAYDLSHGKYLRPWCFDSSYLTYHHITAVCPRLPTIY